MKHIKQNITDTGIDHNRFCLYITICNHNKPERLVSIHDSAFSSSHAYFLTVIWAAWTKPFPGFPQHLQSNAEQQHFLYCVFCCKGVLIVLYDSHNKRKIFQQALPVAYNKDAVYYQGSNRIFKICLEEFQASEG
jgi:hypothetical protein